MSTTDCSIDVAVPVRTVYNQWTQFESFPHLMDCVAQVIQRTDTVLHGVISTAGGRFAFEVEITDQYPDEWISWDSVRGPRHQATVRFHRLDERTTRIQLALTYPADPARPDLPAVVGHHAQACLAAFKERLEARGHETGSWRGRVTAGHVTRQG